MSELYGSPSGEIAYGKFKAEQDHTAALTELAAANTQQIQTKARNDQLMTQIFAGMGGTEQEAKTPEQIIQYLEQKGMQATRAGLVEQGTGMLKDASQMRSHLASARHQDSIVKHYGKKDQMEALDRLYSLVAGVKDQATLDRTIADYEAQNPDDRVPDALRKYEGNEQLFKDILTKTDGGRRVLRAQLEEENKNSLMAHRKEQDRLRDLSIAAQKARDSAAEKARIRREKYLGLRGAKVGQPTTAMLGQAQGIINQEHPGLTPNVKIGSDMYHESAMSVAARAAQLGPERGMDADTAIRTALQEEQKAGHFQEEPDTGILGTGILKGPSKWSYKKKTQEPTGNIDRPLPLPDKESDLKEGKHYMTSKGVAVFHDGELDLLEDLLKE